MRWPRSTNTSNGSFGPPFASTFPHANTYSKPYALSIATIVQDEGRWLPEWLEYHSLSIVGVQHFYIYDDDSRDDIRQECEAAVPNLPQDLLCILCAIKPC
eukprot:6196619-Pleurochrysis_carterae.AAC.1